MDCGLLLRPRVNNWTTFNRDLCLRGVIVIHEYHFRFYLYILLISHEGPFKTRIYGHRTNMRHRHQKGTGLSKYVWKLKGNEPHPIPYEIEWSILGHAKPFDPVTGVCRLCLLEAYFIMFDPEDCTLNTREEFWGSCPHQKKFLLINQKG